MDWYNHISLNFTIFRNSCYWGEEIPPTSYYEKKKCQIQCVENVELNYGTHTIIAHNTCLNFLIDFTNNKRLMITSNTQKQFMV